MAIRLEKGENRKLDLNVFHVGLGWDVNENSGDAFDLDVSAFMITSTGKLLGDDYLVFYNSEKRVRPENLSKIVSYTEFSNNEAMRKQSRPVDPELSVIGSIDDENGETSEDGDDETMDLDESFMLAMEHGMPPISGLGCGLDRLLMLIYNQESVRDVVLFPLMK